MKKGVYSLLISFLTLIVLFACTETKNNDLKVLKEKIETISIPTETDKSLELPSNLNGGIQVEWNSNKENYLKSTGEVTRPTFEEGDVKVVLTATLTLNNESLPKNFLVTVIALPEEVKNTDEEDLATLNEKLNTITVPTETIESLDLSVEPGEGIEIIWTSDNENVISTTGKVTRPNHDDGDVDVTLTVYLKLNKVEVEKVFIVTVLAEEPIDITDPNDPTGYDKTNLMTQDKINQLMSNLPTYVYSGPKIDWMKDWNQAGLFHKDGSQFTVFAPKQVSGSIINVLEAGAVVDDDSFDNTPVIKAIMETIKPGDELYFPEGKYYFKSQLPGVSLYKPNIHITTDNISLRGDGEDKTFIISKNQPIANKSSNTATLLITDASKIKISNLSITSIYKDSNLPKPGVTNENNNVNGKYDSPKYHIVVYGNSKKTGKVIIDQIEVEYFQVTGIRIHNSAENQILNTTIQKATDIGGGGHGYGIEIRGNGTGQFHLIDTYQDTYFNVVANVNITSPYMRHGIILTYMAHNNFVFNNTVKYNGDDGIDLHGQDEFLNYLYNNISSDSYNGAGIGLGNYGNSSNKHAETGVGNVLYQNLLERNRYGVTIQYETFYTQVIENVMRNNRDGAVVEHLEVEFTNIQDNVLVNNENKRVKNPRPKEW